MVDAQLPTSPLSTSAHVLLHVQKCFHGRHWESFPEVKILYCLFHPNQSLIEWNYFLYSKLQSHVLQTYQNIYMFLGRMTEQMEFLHKPVFFSQKRRQKKSFWSGKLCMWVWKHSQTKTRAAIPIPTITCLIGTMWQNTEFCLLLNITYPLHSVLLN